MTSFQGQLYVKIIEAQNLMAVDGSSSDPIVTIILCDGTKKKLESKHIDNNLNPIWNEEYILTIADRTKPVLFDIKDYNKIMKNKPIGDCELDMMKLMDNVVSDVVLPLRQFPTSTLRVLARFTPVNLIAKKPIAFRFPSFRAQIERSHYFPGEIIRGYIQYNVGKPKKIRGVRVKFDGYSHTHWTETHIVHTGKGTQTRQIPYSAHVTYFNPIATLYGNPRGVSKDFKIPSGTYIWPFEFCLPMGLPPSFDHDFGKNYYCVTCYVDIPWATDKEVKLPFQMLALWQNLNFAPTLKASKKTKGSIMSDSGQIFVSASTNDLAYLGEAQTINVTVTNNTSKNLKELKIELSLKLSFWAKRHGAAIGGGFHYWGSRMSTRKVKRVIIKQKIVGAGFPVHPGATWNGSVTVQIPADIPATMPAEISPLIQSKYKLEVTAVSDGNIFTKSSAGTDFTLVVGSRHPADMAGVVAPKVPLGTPYVINVVKFDLAAIPAQYTNYIAPPPIAYQDAAGTKAGAGFYGYILPAQVYQGADVYKPEQWIEEGEGDNLMAAAQSGQSVPQWTPQAEVTPQ